jgi:hypothetical protein
MVSSARNGSTDVFELRQTSLLYVGYHNGR